MSEHPEQGEESGESGIPKTVVIHCHNEAPVINIAVNHYHWPDWLDQHAVKALIEQMRRT